MMIQGKSQRYKYSSFDNSEVIISHHRQPFKGFSIEQGLTKSCIFFSSFIESKTTEKILPLESLYPEENVGDNIYMLCVPTDIFNIDHDAISCNVKTYTIMQNVEKEERSYCPKRQAALHQI